MSETGCLPAAWFFAICNATETSCVGRYPSLIDLKNINYINSLPLLRLAAVVCCGLPLRHRALDDAPLLLR